MSKKSGQLVCQHLENISRKALEQYQINIRAYVKHRHGVYALYNKGKLNYVGLASDLNRRLKHHLTDRHANTWDRFSVYLTLGDQHLRELESLILRIASPKGNRQHGKFLRSESLGKRFKNDINKFVKEEIDNIFSEDYRISKTKSKVIKTGKPLEGRKPVLGLYIKRRVHIRFRYKGKLYIAHVRRDGTISFAKESYNSSKLQGKSFTSPSLAAAAVTDRAMNGWKTWTYERSPGEWVLLDELRK